MFKWLLLFTLIPLLEIYLLIELGKIMGALTTVLLVGATGFFGVILAKVEGLNTLFRFRSELARGVFPGEEIYNGGCLLVGAAFLLTPGLITDLLGLSLLVPFTRHYIKKFLRKYIDRFMMVQYRHDWRGPR